ncbi:MAG TPA: hypothetical protein VGD94_20790 [Vicinamibacterales bacterium]
MAKVAVACSLDGAALAGRQAELRAGVLAEARSVERLSNGYRWRFESRPDLLGRLGPILDAERRCCRFLSIGLTAQSDLGSVVLEITGPDGTVEFLEEWIADDASVGTP